MRVACLFVPLFPLAARLRSEPDLKGEAVVVFEGNSNAARVVAATRKARRAGIEIGMTLPQTRAILPKLVARGRDPEGERAAQEALLEVAEIFSPRVEDEGSGVVYLDLEGLPSLRALEHPELSAPGHPERNDPCHPEPLHCQCHPEPPPCHPERSEGSTLVRSSLGQCVTRGRLREGSTPVVSGSPEQILRRFAPQDDKTSPEHRLGRDLIAAAEKAGLPARAGIAASKLAARIAANLPESPAVVAPGEEAAFLAPLPLSRLAPELEIAQTLERWGLKAIGDLARLPEGEVASRLGELGRALHATARGIDPRPLMPRLPALCFSEGMDLEWPLVTLEPFLFVGAAALERLVQRLESQALACTRLEVALKLDPDGCDTRAIQLPAPTCEVRTLVTLMRLELEARPPGAPVVGFAFAAHPDRPRRAQLALFGPPALSPDRLATTIARLASMLGADRVGSPRTVDGHRPERFALAHYEPPAPPAFAAPPKTGRGLLAIRVLRPPVELEVVVEEEAFSSQLSALSPESSDHPESFTSPCHPERSDRGHPERSDPDHPEPLTSCHPERSEGSTPAVPNPPLRSLRPLSLKTRAADAVPQIFGKVKVAAGPWSMEDGWWSETPADRAYWDIELPDGALYRIYRDRKTDIWFADGIYD